MTLPTFLIAGAAKSGTTALYEYLTRHPRVFMSEPKEPHFLALEGAPPRFTGPGDDAMINDPAVTTLDRYEGLFEQAGGADAVGEASVSTLYYPASIQRIKRYMPQARIVCVLRNPVDRAFSAFSYMRSLAYEPLDDFRAALADEDRRVAAGWHHIWHYRRMGMFHAQLHPFFEAFPREQLRVYLFDDFRRDPAGVLRDCFSFIGVDPDAPLNSAGEPEVNFSGEPKSVALARFLTRDNPLKVAARKIIPRALRQRLWYRLSSANLERQRLLPEVRAEIVEIYRDDVSRLQALLGRDLSSWLRSDERPAPTIRST